MEKKREITEEQVKEYQMLLAQWMQLPKDALEILNEDMPWRIREWLYPEKKSLMFVDTNKKNSTEKMVADLRTDARKYIANNSMHLYVTTMDRLPHLSSFMSRPILGKKLEKLDVYDDKIVLNSTKIEYE